MPARKAPAKTALPIKAPPKPLVKKAMTGLRNPRSQPPRDRASVDGRVGADAAAGAKSKTKEPKRKKAQPRGLINR